MEKNEWKQRLWQSYAFRKILIIMKLTMLLFFVALFQVSANSYAQKSRFDIRFENERLDKVFSLIEEKSDFSIFYKNELIRNTKEVSGNFKNASIFDILDNVLDEQGLAYTIKDKLIMIIDSKMSSELSGGQQQKRLSGKVTDAAGASLPGVSVVIKGTNVGVVTDMDGNFSVSELPDKAVLQFSFVGMKMQEVVVGKQTTLNIVMQEESIGLEEVVAVGYGTVKKSDLTGAVAKVTSNDLNLGGTVSNAAQALQGRTAGVQVTQNSKAPGGSISVRVRGSNSISSSNEPLYVVDGFPTTNGTDINPNDIESMEILKDASATAIYGARGANGVILITTKRGKSGENKISYNGYVGTQSVINPFNMLNGKEHMLLANALYKEIDGQENQEYAVYTQSQLQSTVNTNWINETTQLGLVQDHNIQFKGGSDKTQVLTSLGYYDQKGVLRNTSFSRLSGRINVDQRVNDYIKAGASIVAQRVNSNYQLYAGNILNDNVLLSILTYDPTVVPYNQDGSYGRPPGGRGDNPLANLLERTNDLIKDNFNGKVYFEVQPIKDLVIRANGGAEVFHNFQGTYLPRSTYQGGIDNGVASTYDYTLNHHLIDTYVNYSKKIGEKHSMQLMAGYSYEKNVTDYRRISVKGFSTDLYSYNNLGAASTLTGKSSYRGENILISYFGRVNYSYLDKYLLTVTMRQDGSSRFGSDKRWGTFPSGSFAWRLYEEPFIKDLGLFSNLKFRLGYGKTGNDQIGNYARFALVSSTHLTFDGNTNDAGTHLNPNTPENQALKWETTSQYNTGFDMGFLDNKLNVTIDAYYKKTSDLLIIKNLPSYSGFFSGQSNIGSIENKGIEFELTSNNIDREFKWTTQVNLAANRNKVLDLGGGGDIRLTSSKPMGNVSEEQFAIIRVGEPLGSLYGYVYEGVLQQGESYAPQPNAKPGDPKFRDISGPQGTPDGKITSDDRQIIGNASPDMIFGLTNTFKYKNFDLSIFIHGSLGNELLNMTRMNLEWAHSTDALNRWTTSNTDTDIPRNGFYYSKYGGYINSHFIEDASFLRVKNVTFGYTIPYKNKVFQTCRVYVIAENLLTLTKYSGWDPEVDTKAYESGGSGQTANAGAGLDFNAYPSMRAFTLGLNITF